MNSPKSRGPKIVTIGSLICFAGVAIAFTPAAALGFLLLIVGFFVAVVGRLMS